MPSDTGKSRAVPHGSQSDASWEAESKCSELPLDVTGLSARVAELERDRAQLERFAAVAAHEMSEPLVTTETRATLLLERLGERADPESRSDLEALARSAAKLRLVVDTLLHQARSGASLRRESVDLSQVMDDCLDLLWHEIRCRGARIGVRALPRVMGEPPLLATVMKNLLSNALRYGPRKGGAIRIDASRVATAWRISVVSEGSPIPLEDRLRIFSPFERGRDQRPNEGAGLGLAISRQIVERHGGTLGVEPRPRSNRFYFTIPD